MEPARRYLKEQRKGSAVVERDGTLADREDGATGRPGLKLALVTVLCLVLAGGFLWWRVGGDVFASLITTALAWCF